MDLFECQPTIHLFFPELYIFVDNIESNNTILEGLLNQPRSTFVFWLKFVSSWCLGVHVILRAAAEVAPS